MVTDFPCPTAFQSEVANSDLMKPDRMSSVSATGEGLVGLGPHHQAGKSVSSVTGGGALKPSSVRFTERSIARKHGSNRNNRNQCRRADRRSHAERNCRDTQCKRSHRRHSDDGQ